MSRRPKFLMSASEHSLHVGKERREQGNLEVKKRRQKA